MKHEHRYQVGRSEISLVPKSLQLTISQLSFAMRSNGYLAIRASSTTAKLEFLPHETFRGDVPHLLVDDYAHWLNLSSGDVEFRPLTSRWTSNGDNWFLVGFQHGEPTLRQQWSGTSQERKLVDPRSRTFHAVHGCLGVLEHPGFLLLGLKENVLSAGIPRFRLSFFMNTLGQLQISSFKDMIVDENQSHGTFFGLRNQLVLRAKDPYARALPRSRRVIIPDGSVSSGTSSGHVVASVEIDGTARSLTHHVFVVDNDLRRLCTTSGTTSLLFQNLLHAITSGCLPDPLTGRTGTEQALSDLSSARIKSFTHLSNRDLVILHDIASLSPLRVFYPPNHAVMQQATWRNLPTLTQHPAFKLVADSIVEVARDIDGFRDPGQDRAGHHDWNVAVVKRDRSLTERSLRRSSVYYSPDCPDPLLLWCKQPVVCAGRARCVCHDRDVRLASRHSPYSPARNKAESSIATLSRELQADMSSAKYSDFDILKMLEDYQHIGAEWDLALSYSSLWLKLELLGANWFAVYDQCIEYRDSAELGSRMRVLFSLCGLAFDDPEHLGPTAKALLALCLNDRLRIEIRPVHTPLDLSYGYIPTKATVEGHISGKERGWRNTPANSIPAEPDESRHVFERRQHRYYGQKLQSARVRLLDALMGHWPRTDVHSVSFGDIDDWIQVAPVLESVEAYFENCSRNSAFADHIRRVQTILRATGTRPAIAQPLPDLLPRGDPPLASVRKGVTSSFVALLLNRQPPSLPQHSDQLSTLAPHHHTHVSNRQGTQRDLSETNILLNSLSDASTSNGILAAYLVGLRSSIDSLSASTSASPLADKTPTILDSLRKECDISTTRMQSSFKEACYVLTPRTAVEYQLHTSGLWPRVTQRSFLRAMSLDQRARVPDAWMAYLILYGRLLLAYQRSQRLLQHSLQGRWEVFALEMQNKSLVDGVDDYDTVELDWMLVQVRTDSHIEVSSANLIA